MGDAPGPTAARVLVVGLDPHRVPGPRDREPVARGIAVVADALRSGTWACVVVGGGVRGDLDLFERVVNLVRRHAPAAAIAFNATPEGTYDAAARWLDDA